MKYTFSETLMVVRLLKADTIKSIIIHMPLMSPHFLNKHQVGLAQVC